MCAQVCQAEWVVTRGGLVPKLLHPDVVRGAANVASLRRLRYLVHGTTALRYTNIQDFFCRRRPSPSLGVEVNCTYRSKA